MLGPKNTDRDGADDVIRFQFGFVVASNDGALGEVPGPANAGDLLVEQNFGFDWCDMRR